MYFNQNSDTTTTKYKGLLSYKNCRDSWYQILPCHRYLFRSFGCLVARWFGLDGCGCHNA